MRPAELLELVDKLSEEDLVRHGMRYLLRAEMGMKHNNELLEIIIEEGRRRDLNIVGKITAPAAREAERISHLLGKSNTALRGTFDELRREDIDMICRNAGAGKFKGVKGFRKELLKQFGIDNADDIVFCRVEGDSMVKAGIFSGDLLAIDRSMKAVSGNVVVVMVEDEIYVKRLRMRKGSIWLISENDNYEPVQITADLCYNIIGTVRFNIHKVEAC